MKLEDTTSPHISDLNSVVVSSTTTDIEGESRTEGGAPEYQRSDGHSEPLTKRKLDMPSDTSTEAPTSKKPRTGTVDSETGSQVRDYKTGWQ
jgi:hypothetical protein